MPLRPPYGPLTGRSAGRKRKGGGTETSSTPPGGGAEGAGGASLTYITTRGELERDASLLPHHPARLRFQPAPALGSPPCCPCRVLGPRPAAGGAPGTGSPLSAPLGALRRAGWGRPWRTWTSTTPCSAPCPWTAAATRRSAVLRRYERAPCGRGRARCVGRDRLNTRETDKGL